MEFVPKSVLELLESSPTAPGLPREDVRGLLYQLIKAITFMHSRKIIYRDIKPENLLVEDDGRLKLCDFGFARYHLSPEEVLTDYVATRWYRAPELLLGPPFRRHGRDVRSPYSHPVDMWAIGCLMGELIDGQPLFPGDSDLDQLQRVLQLLGPLTQGQRDLFSINPHNEGVELPAEPSSSLRDRYEGWMDEVELDFMSR